MFKTRLVVAAGALLAACAARALPSPGYVFPSGVQAGTKTRIVVGGCTMNGVTHAYITGAGAKVTRVVLVPGFPRATGKGQRAWVMEWLYDILEGKLTKDKMHREMPPIAFDKETDWAECPWWPYVDERDDLEMQIIARDMFTPENYPQATPALDQLVLLDVEVAADAKPGRREIILCDRGAASAPRPFYITKEPHVQERFFVIPTRAEYHRRKLPAALHIPTPMQPQTPPVYLDGQIWPGEVDCYTLRLEEGQNLVCALTGRELQPYLGDAVPGWFNPELRLYNSQGKQVAGADDFFYLPDPVLTYTVPEDGFYRLEVCDNLYRGRSDFVYFVHCYTTATDAPPYTPQQRAFECYPPPAAHEVPRATAARRIEKGTVECPGRSTRHFIDVKEPGETWKFELFARRLGSPLDGVLRLYGPLGELPLSAAPRCAAWDDEPNKLYQLLNVGDDEKPIIKTNMVYVGSVTQFEIDPVGRWKFTQPGRYCLTVSDRAMDGGECFDYELAMGPMEGFFEVYAGTSAFVSHPGGRTASFHAYLVRHDGFDGVVTFESNDDFEVSGEFAEGEVETDVTVTSLKKDWSGVKTAVLTASGELASGKKLTVRVTPCDPAEQAFAYTHFLPQRHFFFCALGENVKEANPHPLPHLGPKDGSGAQKTKTTHSNGRACTDCHEKQKARRHNKGKACSSCHEGR